MTDTTKPAGKPGRPPTWDEAMLDRTRELWEAGASAGAIATDLTQRIGWDVTRSMVLGTIHRKGWKRSSSPEPTDAAPAIEPEPETLPEPEPVPPPSTAEEPVMTLPFAKPERLAARPQVPVATALPGVDLFEVPMFGCRWPVHDRPFRYCGVPFDPANTYSWCPDHMAMGIDPRSRLQARRDAEKAAEARAARGRAA